MRILLDVLFSLRVKWPYIYMLATKHPRVICGLGTSDTRSLIRHDGHKLFSASKSHFQTITEWARSHCVQSPVAWLVAILGKEWRLHI